jgi:hypothetical protein
MENFAGFRCLALLDIRDFILSVAKKKEYHTQQKEQC